MSSYFCLDSVNLISLTKSFLSTVRNDEEKYFFFSFSPPIDHEKRALFILKPHTQTYTTPPHTSYILCKYGRNPKILFQPPSFSMMLCPLSPPHSKLFLRSRKLKSTQTTSCASEQTSVCQTTTPFSLTRLFLTSNCHSSLLTSHTYGLYCKFIFSLTFFCFRLPCFSRVFSKVTPVVESNSLSFTANEGCWCL